MLRWFVAVAAALIPASLLAQSWNTPGTLALVERAVARRTVADADSTLLRFRALATGVVTFRAEYGAGAESALRLIKADELEVEVYWERPDRSKQVIRAWRDSTYFPTDIAYHRDHLGIVANDFGPRIRIGDGDEVADVPHPLSPNGFTRYDFGTGDTLTLRGNTGERRVVSVPVRPKDASAPGVIGTLFLDLASGMLVRAHFMFTRASYVDRELEDVSVVLERALIDGRWWLPFHQEIEIRRRWSVLDFPLRGVIRGVWDIGDHEVGGAPSPSRFVGPSIGGLTAPNGSGPWTDPLAASGLLASRASEREALDLVRRRATQLVGTHLLDGLPRTRLSLSSVSELARVTGVEGLALGVGARIRFDGPLQTIRARAGWGTADGRLTGGLTGTVELGSAALTITADRSVRDLADVPVISPLLNSLLAQESGRDHGAYFLLSTARVGVTLPLSDRWAGTVGAAREWTESLATVARPARGSYPINPALGEPPRWVASLGLESRHPFDPADGALSGRLGLEVGSGATDYVRAVASGVTAWAMAGGQLIGRLELGAASSGLPLRRAFLAGGRGTIPGYGFRAFGGRFLALSSAEWQVPGPAIPLGPFGTTGGRMVLAPFVSAGWIGGDLSTPLWRPSRALEPSLGLAVELFARTLRVEVAQPLRGGRGPDLLIDVARAWWPIL
jgi:hypothetical protein